MYIYLLFGIFLFGFIMFFGIIIFCIINSKTQSLKPVETKEEETNNLINEAPQLKNFIPSDPIPIPKPKKNIKYFHNSF